MAFQASQSFCFEIDKISFLKANEATLNFSQNQIFLKSLAHNQNVKYICHIVKIILLNIK